jgi:hypothetical protein
MPRLSYSFNQQSLITSPLKRQWMNDDQDAPFVSSDQIKVSQERLTHSGSQDAEVAHSNSPADGAALTSQQPSLFANRAYSVRSDRSSSLHSLPSYDDDTGCVDLLAASATGVLEDQTVITSDSHVSHPASLNASDGHILDAIPRSPRSILHSGGAQQSRSYGTSWFEPRKDVWRKKNLQSLVTKLGVPLPLGSFSSAGHLKSFGEVALDQRRLHSAASPPQPPQPSSDERKSPTRLEHATFSTSKQSPTSATHEHGRHDSPKTSPSKSQSGNADVGTPASASLHDDFSGRPASSLASAGTGTDHTASGFVCNQAPMMIGESSSLDHEFSSSKPEDLNASNQSRASQWLHVIMQLVPPPISGSGSVETLSHSDSSTTSAMSILDKTPACECVRVALIFRASDGSSSVPSSRFMQLVYGLGRLVPLQSAAAADIFTGGLDTTGSRHGSWALTCSSASAQAVFYVPSLIQLQSASALDVHTQQSIDGLVGNCYVTIIYTENEFEVAERSHLLVGDFHWLVITIPPVSCGRNRVFGRMKPGYPQLSIFGSTPKIVSDDALPALLQVCPRPRIRTNVMLLFLLHLLLLLQCAVMSAEVACRIISSGEENYVSSRQERIGAVLARMSQCCSQYSFSSFASTALIRRLKFRLKQSDGASPLPPSAAASPSVHVGRSAAASAHATAAQQSEGGSRHRFHFLCFLLMSAFTAVCHFVFFVEMIASAGFGAAMRMASTVANFMKLPS